MPDRIKLPRRPIRIHVTEAIGHRQRPEETGNAIVDALAVHLQRIACEGARAAWGRAAISRDWMEEGEGETGWRAQIAPDTRNLIRVLEQQGVMRFAEGRTPDEWRGPR